MRSLYWRSGSRKKCRGTTTPTSQFAMLTISVTFWTHSLMISWVRSLQLLTWSSSMPSKAVLSWHCLMPLRTYWYLISGDCKNFDIDLDVCYKYILPNYIIYPMYIAIFWRGFRRSFHPFFVLGKRFPIQASSPSSKMRSQRSNPGARWMVLNFPWEHPHFDAGGMMQGGLPPWLRKPPDDE